MRDPDRLSGYISTTSVRRQYARAMGSEIRDPFCVSVLKPLDYSHSKSKSQAINPGRWFLQSSGSSPKSSSACRVAQGFGWYEADFGRDL